MENTLGKVIVFDGQTGGFSRHTSLDGIFEMCLDDYMRVAEFSDDEEVVKAEYENANKQKKLELVQEIYDYEVLEPTFTLIEKWEEYFGEEWKGSW
jgi:hypothetical protein